MPGTGPEAMRPDPAGRWATPPARQRPRFVPNLSSGFPQAEAQSSSSTKSTRRSPSSHFETQVWGPPELRRDLLLGQPGLDASPTKSLAERLVALRVQCRLRTHRAPSLHPGIGYPAVG